MKKTLSIFYLIIFTVCGLFAERHVFRRRNHVRKPVTKKHELPILSFRKKLALQSKPSPPRRIYVKTEDSTKKNIVIFSSIGGGGHTSVSNALRNYLGDRYNLTIYNTLSTVYGPVDTLGTITFGKVTGEDVYNFCLRCGWTNFLRKYNDAGHAIMNLRHGAMVNLTIDFFKEVKPDLVISVMPHVNRPLLEACEKLDIPFLVLTNDLDTTNYIRGLKPPYYKKFRYMIPFEDKVIREKIQPAQIPDDQIVVTGFPLRPEFFTPKNVPKLKKKFDIPLDKPVVMVFMGGAGSQASYRYVRKLARLGMPMHIIACLGRNERLKRNIWKIMLPKEVTISIFGFTTKIAHLMSISDVLITKPGPNSLCEALFSRVPMILDLTHGVIWWEQLNINFMVKAGFAEPLADYENLETILPKYFKEDTFSDSVKKRMNEFKCARFNETIGPLIDNMVAMSSGLEDGGISKKGNIKVPLEMD